MDYKPLAADLPNREAAAILEVEIVGRVDRAAKLPVAGMFPAEDIARKAAADSSRATVEESALQAAPLAADPHQVEPDRETVAELAPDPVGTVRQSKGRKWRGGFRIAWLSSSLTFRVN
jgi:hypothetical protein